MIKEEKLVSIAILTMLLYALGLFLDTRFFLLPFPIFDLVFFLVFVQFVFWNKKSLKAYVWIYFASVSIKLCYNPLVIGSLFGHNDLQQWDQGLFFDVLKMLSIFFLLLGVLFWRIQRFLTFSLFHLIIFVLFLFLGLTESFFWISPFAPLLLAFIFWKYDRDNPFRYLWILQTVFDSFTVGMLFYSS